MNLLKRKDIKWKSEEPTCKKKNVKEYVIIVQIYFCVFHMEEHVEKGKDRNCLIDYPIVYMTMPEEQENKKKDNHCPFFVHIRVTTKFTYV